MAEKMIIIFTTDDKKSIIGPLTKAEAKKFFTKNGFKMTRVENRWRRQGEAKFGETTAELLPLHPVTESSIPQSDITSQEVLDALLPKGK